MGWVNPSRAPRLFKQIFVYGKKGARRRDDEKSFSSDVVLWWVLTDNGQCFPKC